MRKGSLIFLTGSGMIFLLGGLLAYGLGIHEILPVPRPDLIVVGTSLLGIFLIVSGVCDLFAKKTKEMEITTQNSKMPELGIPAAENNSASEEYATTENNGAKTRACAPFIPIPERNM